jgi:hypothetical protein
MTISRPYLTLLTSLIFATLGLVVAYLTGMMIIVPVLFGLGFPLVNIDKPMKQKIGLTLVIMIISVSVFIGTILAAIGLNFDKYIFPGLLVGLSGTAILGINGLLAETIKLNTKTILATFVLSGISLPVWIILTENVFPKSVTNIELVRQYGVMLFWMTLTTIGICLAIETEDNKAK